MVKNNSHVVRKPAGSTDTKPSGRAARPTSQMDPQAQKVLADDTRAQPADAADDDQVESIEIEVDDAPPPEASKPRVLAHTVRRPK